jgi:hypothetical protein
VNTPHTSEPKGEWAERPYMEVERAARDCIDPRYSRDQTSRVTRTRVKRARGATALASAVKTPRCRATDAPIGLRISAANYARAVQGLLRLSDRRERDRDRRQERAVEGAWRRGRRDPRELVRCACVWRTRVPWFAHSDIIS